MQQTVPEDRTTPMVDPVPVEVRFDPLFDQPQRMMGLVVEIESDLGQNFGRHVGEVITRIQVTQHLH